ncbi:MAG: RNA-binding protein [Chloroflexota bacterium]
MSNKIKRGIFTVLICVTLISCTSVNIPTATTTKKLPETDTTINQTPTITFTPFVTRTLEPVATTTSLPVLSQQISESEIKELLQNDVVCKLPCFLGIIPEKTTVEELKNIFNHFGLPLHDYEGKGRAYAVEKFPNSDIPPSVVFHLSKGLVKSMRVSLYQSNQFEWSIYSPSAILQRFGTPSNVTFELDVIHEPTSTPWKAWYHMTFFYDDLDLIIWYHRPEIRLDKFITVCPNKDDFQGAVLGLGKSSYYPPSPDEVGLLEEVTSFTLESFKEYLLLGPGACFYLKRDSIPIH